MISAHDIDLQSSPDDGDIRALPAGTELLGGQYRIDAYLSSGGFGITYLATDSLGRRVVIKECFPEALCSRSIKTVRARSASCTSEFNELVKMFVREARSLAKLKHPNIVGVHQIFEDNETAYMALDFIDGQDLLQLIEKGKGPRSPSQIVAMTSTLLDAVGTVHNADMLHRDISPDNILIDQSGKPTLIDFGAAREEAKKKSRAISALRVVKDGYSPQEFYITGSHQGPSSDLYSLAATIYHVITGMVPPDSQSRLAALAGNRPDPYVPLIRTVAGYEPGFLRAIDAALAVFPADRPQCAADWVAIANGTFVGGVTRAADMKEVITGLVSEVAKQIDEDSKAECASSVQLEPLPEIHPAPNPELDRWWPLTEPLDEELLAPEQVSQPGGANARECIQSHNPRGHLRRAARILALLVLATAAVTSSDAQISHHASAMMTDVSDLLEAVIVRATQV